MDDQSVVTVAFLRESLTAVLGEHKKLAARVAALESRRLLAYRGAHDPGLTYQAGDCTQKSGSLHTALVDTAEPPSSSGHWREIAITRAKP